MAIVVNRRKVLSVREKVQVIQEIEKGKKKADVFGNLVSLILPSK
jgi:hypothetical protein